MTLEQFAKKAGVVIVPCDPDWGGKIGYRMRGDKSVTVCGFRSERAAYKHWLDSTFDGRVGKMVLDLFKMRPSEGPRQP